MMLDFRELWVSSRHANINPLIQLTLVQTIVLTNRVTSYISRRLKFKFRVDFGSRGVLPCISYIGMCSCKGCGLLAVLLINRTSLLADFGHFGHK